MGVEHLLDLQARDVNLDHAGLSYSRGIDIDSPGGDGQTRGESSPRVAWLRKDKEE